MANQAIGEAFVDIGVDERKYKKGMGAVERDFRDREKRFSAVGSAISGAVAGVAVAGITALTRAFGRLNSELASTVSLSREEAVANARLAAVVKATGGAAGFTSRELAKQASEMQDMIGIGDEVVKETQAIIATFKNISGDQFKETTKLAFDMAAVMGTDAKSAALQLSKALNDPATGLTFLNRSGVTFTKQQQEQIKTLQKSGRLQEAQALVLAEVASQFKGTAAAIDRANGPANNIAEAFGDIKEAAGTAIIELFGMNEAGEKLAETIKNLNMEFRDWLEGGGLRQLATWRETLKTTALLIANDFGRGFDKINAIISTFSQNMGIATVFLQENFGTILKWIADNWVELFTNMPKIAKNAWALIRAELTGDESGTLAGELKRNLQDGIEQGLSFEEVQKRAREIKKEFGQGGLLGGTGITGPVLKQTAKFVSTSEELARIDKEREERRKKLLEDQAAAIANAEKLVQTEDPLKERAETEKKVTSELAKQAKIKGAFIGIEQAIKDIQRGVLANVGIGGAGKENKQTNEELKKQTPLLAEIAKNSQPKPIFG